MTQLRLPFELLMACLYCNYVEHGPEKWLQNHPCAYRKPKSGHNGDEARLGSRVN